MRMAVDFKESLFFCKVFFICNDVVNFLNSDFNQHRTIIVDDLFVGEKTVNLVILYNIIKILS
jgi:hypothetical protein